MKPPTLSKRGKATLIGLVRVPKDVRVVIENETQLKTFCVLEGHGLVSIARPAMVPEITPKGRLVAQMLWHEVRLDGLVEVEAWLWTQRGAMHEEASP